MIDPVGWLTAVAAALALLLGGQPTGWGFQAGAVITDQGVTLGVTPVTVWDVDTPYTQPLEGITLGGTVVLIDASSMTPWFRRLAAQYELGHIAGWHAYGPEYPLAILRHPCAYDPGAFAGCDPWYWRDPLNRPPPPPVHYALHVTIPPSSWPTASTAAAPWHK